MVSILLLAVMMLGALSGLIASYQATASNALRDEGVKLGQELVTLARNTPYTGLANGTTTATYNRQVTNATVTYTTQRTISDVIIGLVKSVKYDVSWSYKGLSFRYTATAIVGAT
jgi:Tfp pilus assembly protein PilV